MPSDDPQTRVAALPDERGTARGRQLLRLSLLAAVVLTGAYVAFVLTSAGQSFDDQSLVGRLAEPGVSRTVRRLLEGIDRGTLIASGFIAGGALMGVVSAVLKFVGVDWFLSGWAGAYLNRQGYYSAVLSTAKANNHTIFNLL